MSYQNARRLRLPRGHMTAVEAKRIVAAYYARRRRLLLLGRLFDRRPPGPDSAPRFPQDFDGIVAGRACP